MHFFAALLSLVSMITSERTWTPPTQPIMIHVQAQGDSTLVLTDFEAKPLAAPTPADVSGDKTVDIRKFFPDLANPGAYILWEVPKGKTVAQFEGTPLVIEVRSDTHRGGQADPQVVHISPLEYVSMKTTQGPLKLIFYYDVAPITVASFLDLSRTGYYDGLTFHRILPNFVIQGGDPKGDGTGGPGYHVPAEFNQHPHVEGVLSMARAADPGSGGSQFFICLDYSHTRSLDGQYTAFGQVGEGMDTVAKIAATPLSDPNAGKPVNPPVMEKAEVKPVTPTDNPYAAYFHFGK